MTFLERYDREDTWYGKALIMGLYHITQTQRNKTWTLGDTAKDFGVSIGLVSENLRLADKLQTDEKMYNCKTRAEAIRKL